MLKKSWTKKDVKEFFIEQMIYASGITSILCVVLIFIFLAKEVFSLFKTVSVSDFLLGKKWYPISEPPLFGILPLILGSLLVTLGAAVISVPIGIASAVYIAEIVGPRSKE